MFTPEIRPPPISADPPHLISPPWHKGEFRKRNLTVGRHYRLLPPLSVRLSRSELCKLQFTISRFIIIIHVYSFLSLSSTRLDEVRGEEEDWTDKRRRCFQSLAQVSLSLYLNFFATRLQLLVACLGFNFLNFPPFLLYEGIQHRRCLPCSKKCLNQRMLRWIGMPW